MGEWAGGVLEGRRSCLGCFFFFPALYASVLGRRLFFLLVHVPLFSRNKLYLLHLSHLSRHSHPFWRLVMLLVLLLVLLILGSFRGRP